MLAWTSCHVLVHVWFASFPPFYFCLSFSACLFLSAPSPCTLCVVVSRACLCGLCNPVTCACRATFSFSLHLQMDLMVKHLFQVSLSIPQPPAARIQQRRSRKPSRITTPLSSVGPRFWLPTVRPRSDISPLNNTYTCKHTHRALGTDIILNQQKPTTESFIFKRAIERTHSTLIKTIFVAFESFRWNENLMMILILTAPLWQSTSAILKENMDLYMLNPCSNKIW